MCIYRHILHKQHQPSKIPLQLDHGSPRRLSGFGVPQVTIGQISLRNFKCFKALDLPCAPLTLLTGRNGGGKSTALQAFLLLVQGLREAPNNNLLPLNGALSVLVPEAMCSTTQPPPRSCAWAYQILLNRRSGISRSIKASQHVAS
ncbi:MAG: ATP-binding protein [Gammaproteobacteria bacterium]|nr:ATP-binding protein [Gammaproteobacteria bacterium]